MINNIILRNIIKNFMVHYFSLFSESDDLAPFVFRDAL